MQLGTFSKILVSVFVWVFLLSTGCAEPDMASKLEGKYLAQYSFGSEELALKSSGVYQQVIRINGDSEPIVSSGTWKYLQREGRVDLTSFFLVTDKGGGLRKNYREPMAAYVSLPVERNFLVGTIRLGPDEGSPYIKQ